jgi:hypothetical protein
LAYLYLDEGGYELADKFADEAEKVAADGDDLLMARARVVRCIRENRLADSTAEDDQRRAHLRSAETYARDSIEYARRAKHPGVLAKALTWLGMTLVSGGTDSPDAVSDATASCREAAEQLRDSHRGDYIWDDFLTLKSRLFEERYARSEVIDWVLGLKAIRMEDFEAYVIKVVWEKHDRKIGPAASELGIRPRRVEDILRRTGHIKPERWRNPDASSSDPDKSRARERDDDMPEITS